DIRNLQLEHDLLKKANELLKKDLGVDLPLLSNREKTTLVDALGTRVYSGEFRRSTETRDSTRLRGFFVSCVVRRSAGTASKIGGIFGGIC
ncbi:hypothetical protein F3J19_29105, partial [Burkholderia sp. Ax-1724]|nr:hypothetical protein [Burkholderia sp. Ax-1724]